jgi:ABC-2 type transport system ATP-binding protein
MIEVRKLVKKFGGLTAVDNITFEVEQGQVLGFLGPNGAGKSTTMKIITGFIPPTSGTVIVGGKDIGEDSLSVRRQIGYLPENAPAYTEMNVKEFLRFIAEVRGLRGAERNRAVERVVEITSLHEVLNQIIDTLSKGYKQRVCFAQAMIHDPPVLILDEPTDGLDPNQKHEMREVIRGMGQTKTIILSTHILEEMEAVCTRAIIIANGRLVVDGTPDELAAMSRYHNAVMVRTTKPQDGLETQLREIKGVASVERVDGQDVDGKGKALTTYAVFPQSAQVILPDVSRFLESKKIEFLEIFAERGRVDEVFRQVTLHEER